MKKICFMSAARSEYGLLKWIMHDVRDLQNVDMQLIVTGGHLLKSQGLTVTQIEEDGFNISKKIYVDIDSNSKVGIAKSMGMIGEKFAEAFSELSPDYLVVLGDRYELLPICSTAFVMGIPIIHISGGDVTEGALDDGIRNSVTMLASYHFPSTKDSYNNILRMRGNIENIWAIGEPGLDAFNRVSPFSRGELAESLNLNPENEWILLTYHAETTKSIEYNVETIRNIVSSLLTRKNAQVIATFANADFGGDQINQVLVETANSNPDKFIAIPSLGQTRYLSMMRQVRFVIGNSSSGIVEAPFLSVPVVNVGERQKGRYQCVNIVQSSTSIQEVTNSIDISLRKEIERTDLNYWGDGHAAERFIHILESKILSKL